MGKHLIGSTHISKRDWGWVGKHGYIVFVKLENGSQNPITAIAVLRSKIPISGERNSDRKREERTKSKSAARLDRALEKGQLPRFR